MSTLSRLTMYPSMKMKKVVQEITEEEVATEITMVVTTEEEDVAVAVVTVVVEEVTVVASEVIVEDTEVVMKEGVVAPGKQLVAAEHSKTTIMMKKVVSGKTNMVIPLRRNLLRQVDWLKRSAKSSMKYYKSKRNGLR